MKKYLMSGLAILCLIGVSGCMGEEKEITNGTDSEKYLIEEFKDLSNKQEEKVDEMLHYVNSSYNEDFEFKKFHPSESGFDNQYDTSFLLAENSNNLKIVMTSRNNEPGLYGMNYLDVIYSKILKKEVEKMKTFEGELFVYGTSFSLIGLSEEQMKQNVLPLAESAQDIMIRIALPNNVNDSDLEEIHKFYNEMIDFSSAVTFEIVGPTNSEKTQEYFDYFNYYDRIVYWYEFDTSIKTVLNVSTGKKIEFEEFKARVEEVN